MNADLVTVATVLTLYLAAVASPGPTFASVSRFAVGGARNAALGATLGVALVALFYALLCMVGLGALIAGSPGLARLLEVLGGCYLVYIGLSAWRGGGGPVGGPAPAARGGFLRGVRAGALVCLANPKTIAFFVGLYAAAIPAGTALWAKGAILAGGFAIELLWYGFVTLLLSTGRAQSVFARHRGLLERVMGTVLAAFGLRMAGGAVMAHTTP